MTMAVQTLTVDRWMAVGIVLHLVRICDAMGDFDPVIVPRALTTMPVVLRLSKPMSR